MKKIAKYRIQKLDRRMNGYGIFSHRICVLSSADFLLIRQWMIENFGPGCELDMFNLSESIGMGYTWAWDTEYSKAQLYFNEAQIGHFILIYSA